MRVAKRYVNIGDISHYDIVFNPQKYIKELQKLLGVEKIEAEENKPY